MTARVLERRATYGDLLAVPEHLIAELIDGELYTRPRPRLRHAKAAGASARGSNARLIEATTGPGGWVIVTGCHAPVYSK